MDNDQNVPQKQPKSLVGGIDQFHDLRELAGLFSIPSGTRYKKNKIKLGIPIIL